MQVWCGWMSLAAVVKTKILSFLYASTGYTMSMKWKNARKCIHLCTNQFSAMASTNEECTPSLRA
jgi:hypothetical protein